MEMRVFDEAQVMKKKKQWIGNGYKYIDEMKRITSKVELLPWRGQGWKLFPENRFTDTVLFYDKTVSSNVPSLGFYTTPKKEKEKNSFNTYYNQAVKEFPYNQILTYDMKIVKSWGRFCVLGYDKIFSLKAKFKDNEGEWELQLLYDTIMIKVGGKQRNLNSNAYYFINPDFSVIYGRLNNKKMRTRDMVDE